MLKADNKRTLITRKGYTHDIINEVSACYSLYWSQCSELANSLSNKNIYQTCKNIFDYIAKKITYVEDVGEQKVKTPARFLKDGEGDCKSFAIFIASCLRCLNIPAFFRYVSFRENKIPTHVYIVTKAGIIIDPVERVNGQPKFNYASTYTYKIDIDIMQPTQISRLTGVDVDYNKLVDTYKMHIQSEPFIDNTIAMNWINSEIDLHLTLLEAYGSETEALNVLNYLDRLAVLKVLYKEARGNAKRLERLANVMQLLEDENVFASNSLNDDERAKRLKTILDYSFGKYSSIEEPQCKGRLYDLVTQKVIPFDYNRVTETQQNLFDEHIKGNPTRVSGRITEDERKEIENKFKASGVYFSYAFLSDKFIKENNVTKNYKQMNLKRLMAKDMIKTFAKEVSSFTNEATLKNTLLSGAIATCNGLTPDQNIKSLMEERKRSKSNVGSITGIIAVVSAIIAVIASIIEILTKVFGRSSVTPKNVQAAKIAEADFDPLGIDGNKNDNTLENKASIFGGKSLPLVAISTVLLGYLIFKKKDDDK